MDQSQTNNTSYHVLLNTLFVLKSIYSICCARIRYNRSKKIKKRHISKRNSAKLCLFSGSFDDRLEIWTYLCVPFKKREHQNINHTFVHVPRWLLSLLFTFEIPVFSLFNVYIHYFELRWWFLFCFAVYLFDFVRLMASSVNFVRYNDEEIAAI